MAKNELIKSPADDASAVLTQGVKTIAVSERKSTVVKTEEELEDEDLLSDEDLKKSSTGGTAVMFGSLTMADLTPIGLTSVSLSCLFENLSTRFQRNLDYCF